MSVRERIEIDFQAARHRAEVLLEASEQLRRVAGTQLENVLQHTGCGWKGENAGIYQKRCRTLSEQIAETAEAMRHTALGIQVAAEVMYRAEMQALQMVTGKNSG